MKDIHVKTVTSYFEDGKSGKKNFEICKNDKNYEVGDRLHSHAWLIGEDGIGGYAIKIPNFLLGASAWLMGVGEKEFTAEQAASYTKDITEVETHESLTKYGYYNWLSSAGIDADYVFKVLNDIFNCDRVPKGYVLIKTE